MCCQNLAKARKDCVFPCQIVVGYRFDPRVLRCMIKASFAATFAALLAFFVQILNWPIQYNFSIAIELPQSLVSVCSNFFEQRANTAKG